MCICMKSSFQTKTKIFELGLGIVNSIFGMAFIAFWKDLFICVYVYITGGLSALIGPNMVLGRKAPTKVIKLELVRALITGVVMRCVLCECLGLLYADL